MVNFCTADVTVVAESLPVLLFNCGLSVVAKVLDKEIEDLSFLILVRQGG